MESEPVSPSVTYSRSHACTRAGVRACTHTHTAARNKLQQGEIGYSDVIVAVVVLLALSVSQEALAIFSHNSTNTRTC